MDERFYFPFYPATGEIAPLPEIDWSKGAPSYMEQLRKHLGNSGALELWWMYPSREAVHSIFNDGGTLSLLDAAIAIGERIASNPGALVVESPELFTCAWLKGEIDPRAPGTLARYSDHPSEIPDMDWRLYPEEVNDFAVKRWGQTVFTDAELGKDSGPNPTPTPATEAAALEAEPGPAPRRTRREQSLYRIIRAMAIVLAEDHPEECAKDGAPWPGYGKCKVTGIGGFLEGRGDVSLKANAIAGHIDEAMNRGR